MSYLFLDNLNLKDEDLNIRIEAIKAATEINLRGNNISSAGAKVLAKVLVKSKTLTTLNLGGNNIGSAGAKALAKLIKKSKTLTKLDLWCNNLGPEGAKALAEGLKESKTLKELDITLNNIGNSGAKAMAEVLKENASMTHLYMGYNIIGHRDAEALVEAVLKNKSLKMKVLDIGNLHRYLCNIALDQIEVKRRVLAMLPVETNWYITAVGRFLRRDGDHAIKRKVVEFLL